LAQKQAKLAANKVKAHVRAAKKLIAAAKKAQKAA